MQRKFWGPYRRADSVVVVGGNDLKRQARTTRAPPGWARPSDLRAYLRHGDGSLSKRDACGDGGYRRVIGEVVMFG